MNCDPNKIANGSATVLRGKPKMVSPSSSPVREEGVLSPSLSPSLKALVAVLGCRRATAMFHFPNSGVSISTRGCRVGCRPRRVCVLRVDDEWLVIAPRVTTGRGGLWVHAVLFVFTGNAPPHDRIAMHDITVAD